MARLRTPTSGRMVWAIGLVRDRLSRSWRLLLLPLALKGHSRIKVPRPAAQPFVARTHWNRQRRQTDSGGRQGLLQLAPLRVEQLVVDSVAAGVRFHATVLDSQVEQNFRLGIRFEQNGKPICLAGVEPLHLGLNLVQKAFMPCAPKRRRV